VSPRPLRCQHCRELVLVFESPCPFIDPELYVCRHCLTPIAGRENVQLELPQLDGRGGTLREEQRRYDPAIAAIPF
jgi:hypothetical protein